MNALMAPIQTAYQASQEWQDITVKAYPPPEKVKKVKKVKDKGSRHPGAAGKDAKPAAAADQRPATELPERPKPAENAPAQNAS